MALGVSMTPPPRVELHCNWSAEAPPLSCLWSPPLAYRHPVGQFPPPIGSLPHQSGAARFGSVGGEGFGGGGVGVGLEDEVAAEGAGARAPVGESLPCQGPASGREAQRRSQPERGSRVPDSRPSVPQAPEATRGRGEGGTLVAGTEPPPIAPAAPLGLPRGAECAAPARGADPGGLPRKPPGTGRGGSPGRGVTDTSQAARAPPASRRGPRGPVPAGAGRRGAAKGALASQPGTSRPASRPRPRPQRASGTHARTQKVKSGASPAPRRRPTPASRPAAPWSPASPSHTPGTSRVLPPLARLPPSAAAAAPPGKQAAAPAAPPVRLHCRLGCSFPRLLPAWALTSPATPRAAASARPALRDWSPEPPGRALECLLSLPGTLRRPAASRPPQPPNIRVLSSAAPGGGESRAPHAKAALPAHKNSPPGSSAGLRAPRAAVPGGDTAPPARRPPSSGPPGKARLPEGPSRRQVPAAVGADLRRRRGSPGCGRHVPVLITAAWLFISMEILPQLPPPPPPPLPPPLRTCGERHRPRELASRGGGSGPGWPALRLPAAAASERCHRGEDGAETCLPRPRARGQGAAGAPPPSTPRPRGPQHLPPARETWREPRGSGTKMGDRGRERVTYG
ncbi:basic proline-rich protein-like [Nannospalax galili]|uniref:basic proline-rich protein-like n=1 Tax=Nannospalax galili TaxID=1026970 RepID=UPI0004ED6A35|nr:basic proline-rich protein-like [Nannospalax galili]